MRIDLKHIETLAKLHVPNAKEMSQRLQGVLDYVSQLKDIQFDAPPVQDNHVMHISKKTQKRDPIEFKDTAALKTNCPKLEEDQVVVPLFVDKS
jgi:aspartyl/glutamyl-tRNA(Asn/Gln) amidotransferase C subunit